MAICLASATQHNFYGARCAISVAEFSWGKRIIISHKALIQSTSDAITYITITSARYSSYLRRCTSKTTTTRERERERERERDKRDEATERMERKEKAGTRGCSKVRKMKSRRTKDAIAGKGEGVGERGEGQGKDEGSIRSGDEIRNISSARTSRQGMAFRLTGWSEKGRAKGRGKKGSSLRCERLPF